jgi:hypothetical protein
MNEIANNQVRGFRVFQAWINLVREREFYGRVFVFSLLHVPLVLLFRVNPIFPTIHAFVTLGIAFLFLYGDQQPDRLIYAVAYIVGSELLWRGTGANVFWEFGKYSVILLLVLALFRYRMVGWVDKRPVVYFALLLPAVVLMPRFDREVVAFNLAGPLAIAICVMFFKGVRVERNHLIRIFFSLLAPISGLAFLATFMTFTADTIDFTGASIQETAAGIGANQVSSILGVGALSVYLLLILEREKRWLRWVGIGLIFWLMGQSMLTFSRGGFWNTLAAVTVGTIFLLRDPRSRAYFFGSVVMVGLLAILVIFPALNRFTGGTLDDRFQDFETTGRWEIVQADWIAFTDEPLLGVGLGQSVFYHELTFRLAAAHTEYSRVLAEHGTFGILALGILLWMASGPFLGKFTNREKAVRVAFMTWSLVLMTHAATRIAAPAVLFGLALSNYQLFESAER